jgi:hypothetical protein
MLRLTVCLGTKYPFGAYDQILIVWQLRICWFGAPSLTRGRVCRLQLLLVLASAVIFGSESRRTRGHILLHNCTFLYNHFSWTEQKTPFPTTLIVVCLPIRCLEMGSSIVPCLFIAAEMFLSIRSLENGCITLLFIRLLHSNGCTSYNTFKTTINNEEFHWNWHNS